MALTSIPAGPYVVSFARQGDPREDLSQLRQTSLAFARGTLAVHVAAHGRIVNTETSEVVATS
jgi:hypothetical protein